MKTITKLCFVKFHFRYLCQLCPIVLKTTELLYNFDETIVNVLAPHVLIQSPVYFIFVLNTIFGKVKASNLKVSIVILYLGFGTLIIFMAAIINNRLTNKVQNKIMIEVLCLSAFLINFYIFVKLILSVKTRAKNYSKIENICEQ